MGNGMKYKIITSLWIIFFLFGVGIVSWAIAYQIKYKEEFKRNPPTEQEYCSAQSDAPLRYVRAKCLKYYQSTTPQG